MKITGIGTHVKVSNFTRSRAFYEALGFNKVFEFGPDKTFLKNNDGNLTSATENYNGIVFEHGGGKFEIADGHQAVKPAIFKEAITSSKVSLMIYIDDIEELIQRCQNASIPLAVGPRHYYWGSIEVVVKDPDGFILVFIAPYSQEVAKKVNADEIWGKPSTD